MKDENHLYMCISVVLNFNLFSRFADIFNKHLRMFLICIYIGSFIGFLWFTLLVNDILPNSTGKNQINCMLKTCFFLFSQLNNYYIHQKAFILS